MPRTPVPEWPESELTRKRALTERHVIAAISYLPGVPSELAPLDCSCGWSGLSLNYQNHRTASGVRRKWDTGGGGRLERGDAA